MGEADAEIADLMGMSADQFFQVVLLPQGEFARFLHADAGDRAKLLQRLFGTDRFHAVEDWLARRRKATADEVREAEAGSPGCSPGSPRPPASAPPDAGRRDRAVGRAGPSHAVPSAASRRRGAAAARRWAAQLAETAAASRGLPGQVAAYRRELDRALDLQRDADTARRPAAAPARPLWTPATSWPRPKPACGERRAELAAAARAAEVAPALAEAERTGSRARPGPRRRGAGQGRGRRGAAARRPRSRAAGLSGRRRQQEHVTRLGRLEALRSVSRQADDEDQAAEAARAAAAALAAQIDAAAAELAAGSGSVPS